MGVVVVGAAERVVFVLNALAVNLGDFPAGLGVGDPGVYTITLRVFDDDASADDSATLTVVSVNAAPVAVDDDYSTVEDTALVMVPVR